MLIIITRPKVIKNFYTLSHYLSLTHTWEKFLPSWYLIHPFH